jgi:hypothetical protein
LLNLATAPAISRLRLWTWDVRGTTVPRLETVLALGYHPDRTALPLVVQLGGILKDLWEDHNIDPDMHTIAATLRQCGVLVEVVGA